MKVYKPSTYNRMHTLYVQPAIDHPENSQWVDKENNPLMFQIFFKHGVAEVEDNLGQYLIDKKLAAQTPLINLDGTAL